MTIFSDPKRFFEKNSGLCRSGVVMPYRKGNVQSWANSHRHRPLRTTKFSILRPENDSLTSSIRNAIPAERPRPSWRGLLPIAPFIFAESGKAVVKAPSQRKWRLWMCGRPSNSTKTGAREMSDSHSKEPRITLPQPSFLSRALFLPPFDEASSWGRHVELASPTFYRGRKIQNRSPAHSTRVSVVRRVSSGERIAR